MPDGWALASITLNTKFGLDREQHVERSCYMIYDMENVKVQWVNMTVEARKSYTMTILKA